jgi:hypothetical protein
MLTWNLKPNRPNLDLSSREQEKIVMNGDPNKMPSITVPDTFTSIRRNHWVASEEIRYANWQAKFPKGQMVDPWELWPFLKGVLQAGEEEGVFRIAEVGAGESPDYSGTSGQSYTEFAEQILIQEGRLTFFKDIERCNAPAWLCYYDLEGNLVKAEIPSRREFGGLGGLLRQLRPDVEQDSKGSWLYQDYNPLGLYGQRGIAWKREDFPEWTDKEFEETDKFQQAYLNIETYTDIWFPWVSGHLENEDRGWRTDIIDGKVIVYKEGELYDNRELAHCHTPRLNRFIQRVKQLTLDYGGKWSIDTRDDSKKYWNEDGIVLDT